MGVRDLRIEHGAQKFEYQHTYEPQPLPIKSHLLLDGGDGLAGVEALGAGLGAVHDGVAAEQLEGVVQRGQTLGGQLVTAVLDPSAWFETHTHSHREVLVSRPALQ